MRAALFLFSIVVAAHPALGQDRRVLAEPPPHTCTEPSLRGETPDGEALTVHNRCRRMIENQVCYDNRDCRIASIQPGESFAYPNPGKARGWRSWVCYTVDYNLGACKLPPF